tara:strand:+ start:425 stop:760 length:336 start_codon:yes stop_codon:yes gene_type:complete
MPRSFDDIKISRRHAAYVVFEGFKPGVYATWEETDEQVKRYSDNKHKGFSSVEKARRAYKRYLKEKTRASNLEPKAKSKAKLKASKRKPKKVETKKRKIALDNSLPPWDII